MSWRSWCRGMTWSTKPCSSRNSARWKPSGSASAMVPGGDARAGEADERLGSGDVHVAQRRERGEDAARRRVRHHAQVGNAGCLQPAERGTRSWPAASATACPPASARRRRRHHDERHALPRGASAARVTFSPTTEPIEPPMNAKSMTQMATRVPSMAPKPQTAASRRPVASLAAATRSGIRLLVDEAERVHRLQARVALVERVVVQQLGEARVDAQPEVVAALGADAQVLLELLVVEHLAAVGALGPEVRREALAARPEGQLDGHQARPWRCRRAASRPLSRAATMTELRPPAPPSRCAARAARPSDRSAARRPCGRQVLPPPCVQRRTGERDARRDGAAEQQAARMVGGRRGGRHDGRRGNGITVAAATVASATALGATASADAGASATARSRDATRSSNRNDGWNRTRLWWSCSAADASRGSSGSAPPGARWALPRRSHGR